ncbi:MAG TPA: DUF6519 domain-containing protein [Pseudomonadota bacterium]|nr:DUF6519 domain-containing protein [Pseudomonadota bacterium]
MTKRSDISRDSFRPDQGYTSVRLQQGRPQLDSDWNEQMDLQYQRERGELTDILGAVAAVPQNLTDPISSPRGPQLDVTMGQQGPTRIQTRAGRVYVEGRQVDIPAGVDLVTQPLCPNLKLPTFGLPLPDPNTSIWIAYLDIFSREVTAQDDPTLREVALGGPDTTTRMQTVWQVRLREIPPGHPLNVPLRAGLRSLASVAEPFLLDRPELAALAPGQFTPDSTAAPTPSAKPGQLRARFIDQGATLENRLYRVEITDVRASQVQIRWSRDNGAVVASVRRVEFPASGGQALVLSRPTVGDASLFSKGQWLEITTAGAELRGEPPQYRRIQSQGTFEAGELRVPIEGRIDLFNPPLNEGGVKARLWNSASEAATYPLPVALPASAGGVRQSDFIPLEDGVEVQLVLPDSNPEARSFFRFAPGQSWQIPMRAALGGIDWPIDRPPQPAQETRHSYLVLGAMLAAEINPNQPQNRAWRYVALQPPAINTLPVLDRRIQQQTRDLAAVVQDRIGPLEGQILRVRTTTGPISAILNTTSTQKPVDITPNLSAAFDRAGFISLFYLLEGTLTSVLNGGPPNGGAPVALSPMGPVRTLKITLVVPVNAIEVRVDMRILALYVRDRTDGDLSVTSSVVQGAPFAPTGRGL